MMPFNDAELAKKYEGFMSDYFATTYGKKEDLFFTKTLFACDWQNKPIATCLGWKAYDEFNMIQWFKVLNTYQFPMTHTARFELLKSFDRINYWHHLQEIQYASAQILCRLYCR